MVVLGGEWLASTSAAIPLFFLLSIYQAEPCLDIKQNLSLKIPTQVKHKKVQLVVSLVIVQLG